MQKLEILVTHLILQYCGIGKLFDLWNSPQIEGYRTYVSLALLGICYELNRYGIAPLNDPTVYGACTKAFGSTAVLGLYEKLRRNHPKIDIVQGVLDDLVDDAKKAQVAAPTSAQPIVEVTKP